MQKCLNNGAFAANLSMNNKIVITAVGVFGSALMWLVSFKIVAILLGPSGVAIYSLFRQIIQATGVASTLGGGNSIVQGLSERSDPQYRKKFRATITRIVCCISLCIAGLVVVFASSVAQYMLSSQTEAAVTSIQILSIGIFLNASAMYLMSVLNGYQSLKLLALVQVVGPFCIVVMLLLLPFVPQVETSIAFASLFVIGSLFSVTFALIANKKIINDSKALNYGFLTKKETVSFIKFSAATLFAALSSSGALLFVRAQIIGSQGAHQAGLFDASWTLTFNYITIFLTACSIFYLPRLSQAKTEKQQMYYLLSTTYIVLACVMIITCGIVIFKSQFLHLLYSEEFYSAQKSLHILAGAVLIRSISWVLSMLMMATKDSVMLLVSELFFNALLILFTYIATHYFSSIDMVAWGLFFANLIYFLWVLYFVKQKNTLFEARRLIVLLSLGVFSIIALFLVEQSEDAQTVSNMPLMQNVVFFCIALLISGSSWRAFKNIHAQTRVSNLL
jgi:O-antigen/teichoic acid export membrane protein